jgi:protein O-mannosyl-transferase
LAAKKTATAKPAAVTVEPTARLFMLGEKPKVVLCLLLVLLTLAVYNPVVHNGFTNYDDNGYITENTHVRAGLTWGTVKWAFTSGDCGNWHPLTWLSHALDYDLFKLNPAGHHYVTVLLHAANAILLFLLLEGATGLAWPSLIVAALFALHPVNVESVAWAAERKNVLSMLFFLLTLHAYGWYVRRMNVKRYAVVAALFALGLMAKPEIITLPFVLLLWDYWPLRRMAGGHPTEGGPDVPTARSFFFLFMEKVPLLVLSAASAVITLVAQNASHAVRDIPAWIRIGNAVVAYVRYIGKAFWPVRLAMPYPHLGRLLSVWEIATCGAVLILLTGLVLLCKDHRYLVVGWFWFLGTLVPVIGLVQVSTQAMADRYAYLSYIGLFVCVIWGVAETASGRRSAPAWLGIAAAAVLITLGVVSRHQIAYWHDSERLWRHTLSVTQRNYAAHDALGHALADEGKVDEAIAQFSAAQNLGAYSPEEMVRFGFYEQSHRHVQEAIEEYKQALDKATDVKTRVVTLNLLGSAFTQLGDFPRAQMSYEYTLKEDPESTVALVGTGLFAERAGDFRLAVAQISHAMKVEPTDVGYLLMGQALRRAGRGREADDADAYAQKISQDIARAHQTASQVLASAGIRGD